MNYQPLSRKKTTLDQHRPLPEALARNLDHWFEVELTYTSNALEGNTLTRRETAVVLEKGITVGGKSLREHLEATNHARALGLAQTLAQNKQPHEITEQDVLDIHAAILHGLDDDNAGRYRTVAVRIAGAAVVLPNPRKVPDLMADFMAWLAATADMHPVAVAGEAHYRLVTIHPFTDGNGRTARLLMNLILMQCGYPPAIIRKQDRVAYIGALETAQLGGPRDAYDKLIAKAAERSLDIYLNALTGTREPDEAPDEADTAHLLKIGALAKAVGETVPTIRHWTKEGLLTVAGTSPGGYQLYAPQMIDRCREIQRLKAERLTLSEIGERIKK